MSNRPIAPERTWRPDAEDAGDRAPDADAAQAGEELLEAAERVERAIQEIQTLNVILQRVDKNVTAAAKRAVKRAGSYPLRLNSRREDQRA